MFMMILLSFVHLAHAQPYRATTLAVSARSGRALVRLHADGFVMIAECDLTDRFARDLWFSTPETLQSCGIGKVRVPEVPGTLARFDDELVQLLRPALAINRDSVDWRDRPGVAVAVGAIAALAYHPLAREAISTMGSGRMLHAAGVLGTGVFAMGAWRSGSYNRAYKKAARSEAAYALVAASPGANPAPPLLIINNRYVFDWLRDVMREALARVDAAPPRP